MYSTSSGNFSTSSPTPLSASSERRDKDSSSSSSTPSHVRGIGDTGTPAVTRPSYVSSPVTTPSAYLTLGGIGGGGSSASISAASYLPSILDNNNIEQTFIDISSVPVSTSSSGTQHQQSGFVPPIIDPPPREPAASFSREQTHPRDLSVSREVTVGTSSSEASNRDRAPTRQEHPVSARDIGSSERTNEFNNNNSLRTNDNIARKPAIGKNTRDASNILRGAHSYGDNMVATNAAMTLQGQLGNWNIPGSLGGSAGGNAGSHQLGHHHSLAGQHALNQSMTSSASSTPPKQQGGPRRHTGPRPPKNEANLSPEEAERRRVRRERNKLAAAKCRKRRMDHTAQLQEETDELESVQKEIHNEILSLQHQKEQLEFILQAHKVHCKRGIPFTALPAVYIPPLTLGSGGDDGGLKEELAGNLSNDSHSSTTSNYSPAPAALQMQMTTTNAMANAVARPTNSINNNNAANAAVTLASVVMSGKNNNGADGAASPNHISTTTTAAAHRPTSLPIKQEPPFVKTESHNQHQQPADGVDVKPEAMDVSVTQATGISISTPKVSPRVLSFFDVMGDHTGLTPITGGGVITSVGSASGTPVSIASATGLPSATTTPPTTKMGTPTDRSNNDAEKPNSGQQQQHTLMSL